MDNKKEQLNKYKTRLDILNHFVLPLSIGGIIGTFICVILSLFGLVTVSCFSIIWFVICLLGYLMGAPLSIDTKNKYEQLLEEIENDDQKI